jgi:hypothetical protein
MVEAATAGANEEFVVYCGLDLDDETRLDYPDHAAVEYFHSPRMRLAEWTNRLARMAMMDGHDILGFLGDDHRPRTYGWDLLVGHAMMELGSGLVYGDDGLQGERLPTAPFWSSDIIQALGWFYPPVLMHLYADDYWLRLANDLGRRSYVDALFIEHEHHSNGLAPKDESYEESERFYDRDREAFEKFLLTDHADCLARVRAVL